MWMTIKDCRFWHSRFTKLTFISSLMYILLHLGYMKANQGLSSPWMWELASSMQAGVLKGQCLLLSPSRDGYSHSWESTRMAQIASGCEVRVHPNLLRETACQLGFGNPVLPLQFYLSKCKGVTPANGHLRGCFICQQYLNCQHCQHEVEPPVVSP